MTPLEAALARISEDLTDLGAPFALVGGLAVSVRTEPRFTRDADLAVAVPDDARAIEIVAGLKARGFGVAEQLEHVGTGRLSAVRLLFGHEPAVFVDLLFASSGIEPEIASTGSRVEIVSGLTVPVATREQLVALKLLSRDDRERPQDAADIRSLLRVPEPFDRGELFRLLALIRERGYERGRDLPAEFRRWEAGA